MRGDGVFPTRVNAHPTVQDGLRSDCSSYAVDVAAKGQFLRWGRHFDTQGPYTHGLAEQAVDFNVYPDAHGVGAIRGGSLRSL